MGRITLSDGTRVKSEDIDNVTLYAKGRGRAHTAAAGEGQEPQAEDRLYVLLKNAKVLMLAGEAVRQDAEKLLAAEVPVFFNEDKAS
jgi:hypothetical protein